MASPVPAKLQPLHSFSLTHLKWKNHRTGRSKLAGESSTHTSNHWLESPPLRSHTPKQQSTIHDSEFESGPNYAGKRKTSESSTTSVDYDNKSKRSKQISFRVRESIKRHDAADEGNHSSTPLDDSVLPTATDVDSLQKTWNLRPRRLPVSLKQATLGFRQIGTSRLQEDKASGDMNACKQLSELNSGVSGDTMTREKRRFSIALSRGEIEEDLLLFTGLKPCRRPKKRPRAVQKQLDNLFPGLWLDTITADSYKVSETPSKA